MHRYFLLSRYKVDHVCTLELPVTKLHRRPTVVMPMASSVLVLQVLLLVSALTAEVVQLSANTMVATEAPKFALFVSDL